MLRLLLKTIFRQRNPSNRNKDSKVRYINIHHANLYRYKLKMKTIKMKMRMKLINLLISIDLLRSKKKLHEYNYPPKEDRKQVDQISKENK